MVPLALMLDAVLGEPGWLWSRLPHPAVLMGRLVAALERSLNTGSRRRLMGGVMVSVLVGTMLVLGLAIRLAPYGWVAETLIAAMLLAQRSLVEHVGDVARGLRVSLTEGRRAVSMIVGRDPDTLDEAGVARAAIESAAENFSDGVLAPAFWFLVAGLPGILIYKIVNTADSMVGYRNERFEAFGWASARLDDLLNWIPARLCGAAFCLVGSGGAAWAVMRRDARLHASPNAGWPEAAVAASLGLALAGPRIYGGALTDDPYMNAEGRPEATPDDIDGVIRLLWFAWLVVFAGTMAASAMLAA